MVLFQINFFAGDITSVKMSNRNYLWCGGESTKIEIVSPISCRTWSSGDFDRGSNVYWKNSDLGSCNGKQIYTSNENVIVFKIYTSSGNDFCPEYVNFALAGGYIEYKSGTIDYYLHDNNDNSKRFYAYRQ